MVDDPQKILIVAPNASSRFGGEAFLPLKYFQILRRRGLPAKLIAHARNREDLTELLAPFLGDIHFVEDTIWHRAVWAMAKPFPSTIREAVFSPLLNRVNEHYQGRLIRGLVAAGEVDLIHQPTPVSPLAPSGLHRFGVPLVVGPMNGGMVYPPGYEDIESPLARRFVSLARMAARVVNVLSPGKREAAAVLVANERTRRALPFPEHPAVFALAENGVDLATWKAPLRPKPREIAEQPFRLVYSGRLVRWKAVDLTLKAVALARERGVSVELDILGDGSERNALEALSASLSLSEVVRFHGFKRQSECVAHFAHADAMILNSVYECGGAVVLEAMAMGLAVIGPDWGGPADYIDAGTGIRVSPVPRENYSERLADAIGTLARDPALRWRFGQAGMEKIRAQYDWEAKVDRMREVYAFATGKAPRPAWADAAPEPSSDAPEPTPAAPVATR